MNEWNYSWLAVLTPGHIRTIHQLWILFTQPRQKVMIRGTRDTRRFNGQFLTAVNFQYAEQFIYLCAARDLRGSRRTFNNKAH
jgi:hypothetical protein